MSAHIVNGKFQSDKYPTCPPGKVPLSVNDKTAQDLLWVYAQRRRAVDEEFGEDLSACLIEAGYKPPNLSGADDLAEYIAGSHGFVKPAELTTLRDQVAKLTLERDALHLVASTSYRVLAMAFNRIHSLPRETDSLLAKSIGQVRADIEKALPVAAAGRRE